MSDIACCWLPSFALRVLMHAQRLDFAEPAVLISAHATHSIVLDCTPSAYATGVRPGMLMSRALGCCAELLLIEHEISTVEQAAEAFISRLEQQGAEAQATHPGRVFFAITPLLRLYDGFEGVLKRMLGVFNNSEVRIGVAPNLFTAWIAAQHAPSGQWLYIKASEVKRMLAPMPLTLLPVDEDNLRLFKALGLEQLGDLAALDRHQITDRFGESGVRLHDLANGIDHTRLTPRILVDPVIEEIIFPEPVANTHTLVNAIELLTQRLVQHPQCKNHAPSAVVLSAQLVNGKTWQARRSLRVPTLSPHKLSLAIQPTLTELPAAVEQMSFELTSFSLQNAAQDSLLLELDRERAAPVQRGINHVHEALGEDALLQVLEVEPWSRIPERHAVLVPRSRAAEINDEKRSGFKQSSAERDSSVGRGVWH